MDERTPPAACNEAAAKRVQILRVLAEMVEEFDAALGMLLAFPVEQAEDRRELHGRDGTILHLTVSVRRAQAQGELWESAMTDRARAPRPARTSTIPAAIEANASGFGGERACGAMRQKVQIARKQLGLTEEDYRARLLRITGKTSSTACTTRELDAVLRDFATLGWKAQPVRKISPKAQVRMIHAVYADIQPLLAVGGPEALRSFVRRQTKSAAHPDGIDAPEFLDPASATKVLEGLKAWRARLRRSVGRTADDVA